MGWRYSPQGENMEFNSLLASTENVPQDHVVAFPGSSIPLANSAGAFTSPTRSWVMGGPGYGSGAGRWIGAKTIKVPLRKDYSHDVEAMIKADPNAGAFYICNPNNPTGTLTPRKDLEYILANKPKDAVLIIDEAYVHFPGPENYVHGLGARRTKTSWCCAPSRRSTAWPACAPARPTDGPTCWPEVREFGGTAIHARDRDGVRRRQHEARRRRSSRNGRGSTRRIAIWRSSTWRRWACATSRRSPTSS